MYFLKHGVRADDGAHYVVVTQTDDALLVLYCICSLFSSSLHTRPAASLASPQADYFEELRVHDNVRFLRHNNECYDW